MIVETLVVVGIVGAATCYLGQKGAKMMRGESACCDKGCGTKKAAGPNVVEIGGIESK